MHYHVLESEGKFIAHPMIRVIHGVLTSDIQKAQVYPLETDAITSIAYLQEHYPELTGKPLVPRAISIGLEE
jgi:hypothetical protein